MAPRTTAPPPRSPATSPAQYLAPADPGPESRVAHPLQHRDLVDLGRLQVIPEDASRTVVHPLDLDHGAGGGDQVHRQVVIGDHQVLAKDLDRVSRGGDGGVVVDLPSV